MLKGLLAIAMACLAIIGWSEVLPLPSWTLGPLIGLLAWGLIEGWD